MPHQEATTHGLSVWAAGWEGADCCTPPLCSLAGAGLAPQFPIPDLPPSVVTCDQVWLQYADGDRPTPRPPGADARAEQGERHGSLFDMVVTADRHVLRHDQAVVRE